MAGPIKLTEVDFEEIKENLINYLKSTKRFTDYDFEGSNLQVILNLISYQAQLNAYTTNMLANESFLSSSTIRTNVVENANMLGYLPTSARAAISESDFDYQLNLDNYPQGYPSYLEIRPGPLLTAGNGNETFTFNILSPQVAAVASSGQVRFRNVRSYEGFVVEIDFEVNDALVNQRFFLENENIDTTTITIEVQEDPNEDITAFYQQANNLTTLTEESRTYWVEETRDSHYELKFGDGYFGRKLANGAKIHVTYLVTNGNLANGMANTTNETFVGKVFDSFGYAVTQRASILSTSLTKGGADIEDVASIKLRAPKNYAAQNRCVTTDDYEALIRQIYPATEDIYVFGGEELEIPQYGRVYISIKPKNSDAISMITEKYIRESLQSVRVASLDLAFVDPTVINVELDSLVYYNEKNTTKDSSLIVADVVNNLTSYKDSSVLSKFGGAMRYSVIAAIIDDSDKSITRNNTKFRLRRDIKPVINTSASYRCCFDNPIIENEKISVFASSGFQQEINGVFDDKVYYMEDDGKGNIRTFYITKNNTKVIADTHFGTIDYEEGTIQFGYDKPVKIINVTTDNSVLELRVLPREQDIIAKESVFLNLDIGSSSIGATVDTQIAKS